jgi:hypothetical protein
MVRRAEKPSSFRSSSVRNAPSATYAPESNCAGLMVKLPSGFCGQGVATETPFGNTKRTCSSVSTPSGCRKAATS